MGGGGGPPPSPPPPPPPCDGRSERRRDETRVQRRRRNEEGVQRRRRGVLLGQRSARRSGGGDVHVSSVPGQRPAKRSNGGGGVGGGEEARQDGVPSSGRHCGPPSGGRRADVPLLPSSPPLLLSADRRVPSRPVPSSAWLLRAGRVGRKGGRRWREEIAGRLSSSPSPPAVEGGPLINPSPQTALPPPPHDEAASITRGREEDGEGGRSERS